MLLSDVSGDLLSQIEELTMRKQTVDGAIEVIASIVNIAKGVLLGLEEDLKAAFLEEAIARLQALKDGDNSIQISISPVPSLGILSCSQLEERLGVGVRGQVNKKDGNFGEWSKAKDPDGLEWKLFRYHGSERPAYEFAAVTDSAACAELEKRQKERAHKYALSATEEKVIELIASDLFLTSPANLTIVEWDTVIETALKQLATPDTSSNDNEISEADSAIATTTRSEQAIAENPASDKDDYDTLEEAQDFATELASEYFLNPEEHLETLANELFDIPFNYLSLQQIKQLINRCKDDIDKLKEQGALLLNAVKEDDEELEKAAF